MKRFDKTKNIQRLNESLNKKKNNLTEDFGGGKEYYDHILQGHEATEENAYDHARGIDWMAVETTPQNLPNLDFIDSVNGVEIYYDHGADYYCFSPAEGDMGTMGESKKPKSLSVLNETSQTMFEKLCGVKILKEFEVGYNSGGRYLDNKDINNPDDIQAVGSGYVERPKKVEGVNLSEYNKCYNFDGPIIQYVTDEGEALLVDITHDYKEETKAGITVLQFCLKYLEKKGYKYNASMEIQKPGQEPRYNKYGNVE